MAATRISTKSEQNMLAMVTHNHTFKCRVTCMLGITVSSCIVKLSSVSHTHFYSTVFQEVTIL